MTRRRLALGVLSAALAGCGQDAVDLVDAELGSVTQEATINGGNFAGANLTPANGDVLNGTFTNVGTFTISAGTTVFIQPGVSFDMSSTTTVINGILNADGRGFAGGPLTVAPGGNSVAFDGTDGTGPGKGIHGRLGNCVHGGGGGGGGYGGAGGTGEYHFADATYPNGGITYGSDTDLLIEQ